MNRLRLAQLRRSYKTLIDRNPTTITIERMPMVDDGFGGEIEDPFGTPEVAAIKCRLSHERAIVPDNNSAPSGLSTNLQRYITVAHDVDIFEGDVFTALEKDWKIGPVDPLVKFGGVYGYQAPLVEATQNEST